MLDNAMRYAATSVTIRVVADRDWLDLEILDDGPGIPEAMLDHVLKRGGRLDETSGGAGLGLAIARDIAAGAGGSIALSDNSPGLRVIIRLASA